MSLADEGFEADLAEIIDDLPAVITWQAQAITVTIGDMVRTNDTSPEGIFNDRRLDVAARVSSFTNGTLPEVQDSVDLVSTLHPNLDGRYFVEERLDSPDGTGVNFVLLKKTDPKAAKK